MAASETMIDVLISMVILILSAVIGFGIFYSTTTTGWSATVMTIWGYIPLIFIFVGIILLIGFLRYKHK